MLIFTGADGNYALQAQVWTLSLVKTQRIPVRVIIFGNGWSKKNHASLKSLENDKVTVEIREIDQSQFSKVRLQNNFPLAATYNVLAPLVGADTRSNSVHRG